MKVGAYELRGEIGRGGMGAVYRAFDPATGREVALKVLLGAEARGVRRKRFLREAVALARLRHPSIVSVYDGGESEGRLFLAMELVEGESLAERLRREGPLAPREAAELVARIARAVSHAHERQLLHRDLKPANVLLAPGEPPRLTDFGLVRDLTPDLAGTQLTHDGAQLGTPGYWAPEQARGDLERLGPATDVFGLGGLLHAALTTSPPNQGETLVELLHILDSPPGPLPGLDPALDRIRRRCLQRDPSQRYPTALAVARALETWRDAPSPPRARSLVWVALAALGIVLGVAAAASLREPSLAASSVAPTSSESAQDPEGRARVDEVIDQASAAMQAGRLVEARQRLDEALALDPESARALAALGYLESREGRMDAADANVQRALELAPELSAAHRALGMIRCAEKRYAEALPAFDRALELEPDDLVALALRGDLRWRANDLEGALRDLNRAIELDTEADGAPLHELRGKLCLELGDPDGARRDFELRSRLEPEDPLSWIQLGWACYDQGAFADAARAFQRVTDVDPRFSLGWFARAYLATQGRRYEGARQHLARVNAQGQSNAPVLFLSAVVATLDGDQAASVRFFREIERLDPVFARLYRESWPQPEGFGFARAMAHFWACLALQIGPKRLKDARVWSHRAVRMAPAEPSTWIARGRIRFASDDVEGARADWRRALSLLSDDDPRRRKVERYLADPASASLD